MTGAWTRRAVAAGAAAGATRGQRFVNRSRGGRSVSFAALRAVPGWLVLEPAEQRRFAAIVGLLHHRAPLQGELRGALLAPLAGLVGEAVFDCLLEADVPDEPFGTNLPGPAGVVQTGQDLLARATRPDERYARALADRAEQLLLEERRAA